MPLFSVRSRNDWGIGEIGDLPMCAEWVKSAGHTLLQVLPVHDLGEGETSPYGARTAFGLDVIYLSFSRVPDFRETDLDEVQVGERERLRALARTDYKGVRALKEAALEKSFTRFFESEWAHRTERARGLIEFFESERAWLSGFTAYSAGLALHGWNEPAWEAAESLRDGEWLKHTINDPRTRAALRIVYAQWHLFLQWDDAKRALEAMGVELMGDLPFIVGKGSADVWAHPTDFDTSVSLGAPPDDFSADGQDWGLPAYAWEAMDKNDLAWLRKRAAHAGRLYHRYRIDHVVGFFRMWLKKDGGPGAFTPTEEEDQQARGEKVMRALIESSGGARVIAEDLGVIPDFVRRTLRALEIPGYKVIPWERNEPHVFRDPRGFDACSVGTWSTHDTAPITAWWGAFAEWEKKPLAELAHISPDAEEPQRTFGLLRLLYECGSDLTLSLIQEMIGEDDRINTPGTVGVQNWTYRLPKPIEEMRRDPNVVQRFATILQMVRETDRIPS